MKWLKNINSFELVYIAISVATFTHTTWAAATVFEGPQPAYVQLEGLNPGQLLNYVVENFDYFGWLFAGALIAIAVDVGMLIAARELSKKWNWLVLLSFVVGAAASFYTQLTYSLFHTGAFDYGDGVTRWWRGSLTPLIDARVIIIPLMLPLFAIIYTFARISKERQIEAEESHDQNRLVFVYQNRVYGPYSDPIQRDVEMGTFIKQLEAKAKKRGVRNFELPVRGEDYDGLQSGLLAPTTSPLPIAVPVAQAPYTPPPIPQSQQQHQPPMIPSHTGGAEASHSPFPLASPKEVIHEEDEPVMISTSDEEDTSPTKVITGGKYIYPANWDQMDKNAKRKWRANQRALNTKS